MKMLSKSYLSFTLAATSLCSSVFISPLVNAEALTVYTAFETEQLAPYKAGFEAENPDIEIHWVRDSTGIMTAKLLAEKNNPQAEVIWGLAGSSMALLKNEGIVKPYVPQGLAATRSYLNDPEEQQAWFGNDAFFNAICFNEKVADTHNLPKPTSWKDLTKSVYQGHIAMPNPASSGTGYMQVSTWLQTMGEKQAWQFMQALDQNIAHYTHSGSKPCVQAAMGEVAIGISMASRGAKLKTQGAPIDILMPSEGIGWEAEAVGLVNTQSEAAKRLIDWTLSRKANELYSQFYPIVSHKNVRKTVANYPNVEDAMVRLDFSKMAQGRSQTLATWSEKFDAKSEPK